MQTQFMSLPIAGSIRHGEKQEKNGKSKPIELGYFIAKIQDTAMSHLQAKFQEIYNNSKILNIYFLDDNPLTIRRVKYNQSGATCYCLMNQQNGKEKVGKKWIEKECLETCEYRSSPEGKRPQCSVEATLKFMIPDVSSDRIWYLKTSSYYSIQNLSSYITLQKKLNNSLIGNYKLFLKQKENIIDGKTFNNFVLDIVKNENFNSNQLSNKETIEKSTQPSNLKNTKGNSKSESIPIPKSSKETPTEDDLDRYYVLIDTKDVTINRKGKPTKYLEAKLCNKDSKEISAIIHPKYAKDMSLCELGSQFLMDIEEFGQRLIVNKCEYLVKQLKEAV